MKRTHEQLNSEASGGYLGAVFRTVAPNTPTYARLHHVGDPLPGSTDFDAPTGSAANPVLVDVVKLTIADATPNAKSTYDPPSAPRKAHRPTTGGKSITCLRFVLLKRIDLVSESQSDSESVDEDSK